jgi:hypothetical protein
MRRRLLVVLAVVGPLVGCGGSKNPARTGRAASCVGPQLSVTPAAAHAGDTVRASGEWFAADCYDTGQAGMPPPLTKLLLHVSQRERSWTVASGVNASGSHYTFDLPIELPSKLRPGIATVAVMGHGAPVEVHVLPK